MSEQQARGRAVYDHTNDEPRPSGRRRRQVADWGVGDELFDHMPRRRFGRAGTERAGAEQPRRGPGDGHDEPPIPRGGTDDGRRTIVIGEHAELPPLAPERQDDDHAFASREDALRARAEDDALWGGDEPFARGNVADEPSGRGRDDVEWGGDDPFARGNVADEPSGRGRDDVEWGGDDPFARGGDAPVGAPGAVREDDASGGEELAGEAQRRNGGGARGVARTVDRRTAARHTEAVVRGAQGGRRTVKIGGRPGEIPRSVDRPRRPPRTVGERLGASPDRVAAWAFALGLVLILIAIATASAG